MTLKRVAVCIPTFRRPVMLGRLLESLSRLNVDTGMFALDMLVIDNDALGSAAHVVKRFQKCFPFPLIYCLETKRGLPCARNFAVALTARHHYLAMIDDDEIVEPTWLASLLATQLKYNADAVAGPVVPRFEKHPPQWVLDGCFFDRARRKTGSRITYLPGGNVLFRRSTLNSIPGPFDERLGLMGGSDTMISRHLNRMRATLVWDDDAVAREWIPKTRVAAAWILQRAFRTGHTLAVTEGLITRSLSKKGFRSIKGMANISMGIVLLCISLTSGRASCVNALKYVCKGTGTLWGVLGIAYNEYSTIHGR